VSGGFFSFFSINMTELTPQVRLGKIVLDFSTLLCRFCFVGTTTEID